MTMLVLLQALNVLFQLVTPTTCKRANYPDKDGERSRNQRKGEIGFTTHDISNPQPVQPMYDDQATRERRSKRFQRMQARQRRRVQLILMLIAKAASPSHPGYKNCVVLMPLGKRKLDIQSDLRRYSSVVLLNINQSTPFEDINVMRKMELAARCGLYTKDELVIHSYFWQSKGLYLDHRLHEVFSQSQGLVQSYALFFPS